MARRIASEKGTTLSDPIKEGSVGAFINGVKQRLRYRMRQEDLDRVTLQDIARFYRIKIAGALLRESLE